MAPLPLIKIGAVLFKEVSKPLAAGVKRQATEHPGLRRVATALGRAYESGAQRVERAFSANRLAPLKAVSDSHALSVGADLLAQGFLVGTAIGFVVWEYNRSAAAKAADDRGKEARKLERQRRKNAALAALAAEVAATRARLEAVEGVLAEHGWAVPPPPGGGRGGGGGGGGGGGEGDGGSDDGGGRWTLPARALWWWPLR
jgi:uncharacterized membrane protein YgcG